MLKNQALRPHSLLLCMGLALFAMTRPSLSTAKDVSLPVDSNGNVVPHTFIKPGKDTGCAAYKFRENYRWICEDNPDGDDRNEPLYRDENGVYKFTVYYGWEDPRFGTTGAIDKPVYFAEFETVSQWEALYTTRENCLASQPTTINGWDVPGSSYTISPCPAKIYNGPPLKNPYVLSQQQRQQSYLSPPPAQIIGNNGAAAAAADGSSNFQLSSLQQLNPDVVIAPLPLGTTDNTIINNTPLDKSQNPIAVVADTSLYPPQLNTASLDITTQAGGPVAPSDLSLGEGEEYGYWQKEKRDSRALNQRRRKAVLFAG